MLLWRLELIVITSMTHLSTPDSPVTSVVTVASPVTTAKNPLLATPTSEVNLTVMVVAVTGPGVEVPENVWVVEPAITSTVSSLYSVLNAAKVTVTGSPAVDSILHV